MSQRSSAGLKPIRPGSLHKLVTDQLQERILDGRFAPEQALPPERELAKLLGVSRTVVRDALRTLDTRGLIEVRHGMPTIVSDSSRHALASAAAVELLRSDATMRSLIEARRALETGAAVTAALQAGAVDWSRPHAALDTFATAVSAGEWSATEAAHLAFHLSLLRVVQNRSLDVLLEPLHEVIVTTSLHPELSEPEVWELVWHLPSHRELLAAMESGDRTRTLAAVDAHFAYVDHPRYAEFLDMRLSEIPAVRRRLVEQLSQ